MKSRAKAVRAASIESEERLTVSLKTLAELLDAHRVSVRRWLRDAGVHPVALGRGPNSAIRYYWKEVEVWLASLQRVD